MITITLNGEHKHMLASQSMQQLMEALRLEARHCAVERNGAIVPRSCYADTFFEEGDAVEIVRFIGGG